LSSRPAADGPATIRAPGCAVASWPPPGPWAWHCCRGCGPSILPRLARGPPCRAGDSAEFQTPPAAADRVGRAHAPWPANHILYYIDHIIVILSKPTCNSA